MLLRAFEAAARLGSFKRAATELGVTHGAISRHVRLLEDWLGPPALFRRLNRRVGPTPTGVALLAETGPALDRLSAAAERHQARGGKPPPAVLCVNALATFSLRGCCPGWRSSANVTLRSRYGSPPPTSPWTP